MGMNYMIFVWKHLQILIPIDLFVLALTVTIILLPTIWVLNLNDLSILGVFNQTLAVYVLLSQIINFGLYYSILYFTSKTNTNKKEKIKYNLLDKAFFIVS